MIYKLMENRVFRTYPGGSRIDRLLHGVPGADGMFPEDWLASTVRAFNPGREHIPEGLGKTEDGTPVSQLAPQGLPILVKLLDAAQRLVIQVHPTRAFAMEAWHSPVGKTECWYVLEAEESACVYIGFQETMTRERWIDACNRQDIPAMLGMLHCFPVKSGDCVFVPGGVPHAIGGGCLLLETQEPSDLMVVPERRTPAGLPLDERKLHGGLGFSRMYDCFQYKGLPREEARKTFFQSPVPLEDGFLRYVDARDNGIFSVLTCRTEKVVRRIFQESFAIAVVTEGCGSIEQEDQIVPVRQGDRLLILNLAKTRLTIAAEASRLAVAFALPSETPTAARPD